jgi:hypothetical protein
MQLGYTKKSKDPPATNEWPGDICVQMLEGRKNWIGSLQHGARLHKYGSNLRNRRMPDAESARGITASHAPYYAETDISLGKITPATMCKDSVDPGAGQSRTVTS